MKRSLKWIGGILVAILGIFFVAGVVGFVWMGISFKRALDPKVSLDQYESIVASRQDSSPRYAFLPASIHENAEASAFFHIPGFMQGADIICLRQRLPQENIDLLLRNLEQSGRIEVHDEKDLPLTQCYPDFEIGKRSGRNVFAAVKELPEGFRIFLYESDLEDIKENWNHNFLAFTAVSTAAREVVYYVDNW